MFSRRNRKKSTDWYRHRRLIIGAIGSCHEKDIFSLFSTPKSSKSRQYEALAVWKRCCHQAGRRVVRPEKDWRTENSNCGTYYYNLTWKDAKESSRTSNIPIEIPQSKINDPNRIAIASPEIAIASHGKRKTRPAGCRGAQRRYLCARPTTSPITPPRQIRILCFF